MTYDPTKHPDSQRAELEAAFQRGAARLEDEKTLTAQLEADARALETARAEGKNAAYLLRLRLTALHRTRKPPAMAALLLTEWHHIDRALRLLDLAYAEQLDQFDTPVDFMAAYLEITQEWRDEPERGAAQ